MPFDESLVDKGSYFFYVPEGETAPPLGDGKTYSRALGWQSPEGNFYGQERWVRDWPTAVVWNGEDYQIVEADGVATSFAALPIPGQINPNTGAPYGPRTDFEIWSIPRLDIVILIFEYMILGCTISLGHKNQEWKMISWYWSIEGEDELPRPGLKKGAAHILYYYNIKVMWDGLVWRRYSIDMLEGSERVDNLESNHSSFATNTNGALQLLNERVVEARLEFLSKTLLGLVTSVRGNDGVLWVNGELLAVDDVANVSNSSSVVHYVNNSIIPLSVTPDTEYYVYCANSDFPSGPKLFLSLNEDINGKLGTAAPGSNARIVGVVEIDDQGYFRREIDMSYIGKKVEFSETFWEYSDYTLAYKDENTLEFQRLDGTSGLCYVNGQLLSLGSGKEVATDSYRIDWNDGDPLLDETAITASTFYQIYIANDSYEYNFNELGDDGFPVDEGDVGYDAAKDFRRSLFLSTKEPDNRLFDQQYPGYYARHIGQVATDSSGYFKYSSDISLIRQPTLNPTTVDGLAEITFLWESSSQIGIIAKRGTNGLVYVNGERLTVDGLNISYINTDSLVYSYNGATTSPLDVVYTVKDYIGRTLYLYITNNNTVWGSLINSLICSSTEPVGGYLDGRYPGNNCRWIGTIRQAPQITGDDLVTNGNFATDTDWVYDKGWEFDDDNDKMTHVSGVLPLSQDITLTEGQLYRILFTTSGATEGSVKVSLGGTESASFSNNAAQDIDLEAGTGDYIYFIPTQTYDGSLDDISVKITSLNLITNGTFDSSDDWDIEDYSTWSYDSGNDRMSHSTVSSTSLSQDITLTEGTSYVVTYTQAKTAGTSITPCVGGTDGTANTSPQTLTAGSGDYLSFKATTDVDGYIDTVSLINNTELISGTNSATATMVSEFEGYPIPVTEYLNKTISVIEGNTYLLTFGVTGGVNSANYVTCYLGATCLAYRVYTSQSITFTAGTSGALVFTLYASWHIMGDYVSISNVSVKSTTNLVINSALVTSDNWTFGGGWVYDDANDRASHTHINEWLTQDITLTDSASYRLLFDTSISSGSITPCLGGTDGSAITTGSSQSVTLTAGSSDYLRFKVSSDFVGYIDNVVLKLTGSEICTNGGMATDTNWNRQLGWIWDGVSYHMDYLPQSEMAISQDISAVENEYYELTYNITNYISGTLTPIIGGTEGLPASNNGYKTQHILAGDSEILEFVASPAFEGSLDFIGVRKTLGTFENSFLSESVSGISASINDSIVSITDTWSSAKIMSEFQKIIGITSAEQTFENQKVMGLSLKLEYVDTTHVRVIPTIVDAKVFFSVDVNDYLDIPGGGVSLEVSGSVNTTYYVWLAKESIYMNTDAPTDVYVKLSMRGDAVLVGYIALSATDTIAGDWNVYSFYNEPVKSWTSSNINSEAFTFSKPGLIIPPNGSASLTRTGATSISISSQYLGVVASTSVSVGTSTCSGGNTTNDPPVYGTEECGGGSYANTWLPSSPPVPSPIAGSVTVSVSPGASLGAGIYNSVSLSATKSITNTPTRTYAYSYYGTFLCAGIPGTISSSFTARSGNLIITRQGNI